MIDLKLRLLWSLLYRRQKMRRIKGFWAHWNTYADKSCSFSEYNHIYSGAKIIGARFGKYTYVTNAVINNCSIGAFCSIGRQTIIGGMGTHPSTYLSTHPAFYSTLNQAGISFVDSARFDEYPGDVVIGNDVWIGARALILDGVKIGDGAIIAAGSTVTKDVEPYAIAGGIPAKTIKYRFSKEVIKKLCLWKWWDLAPEILNASADRFTSRNEWAERDIVELIEYTDSLNPV